MASLRALPALKAGTLEAAIFIFSPVWGFLPSLALRSRTENFPKPVILTSSPLLSASVTTLSKAPKYFWASPSGTPASSAILSMSSPLFMVAPFSGRLLCSCAAVLGLLTPRLYGSQNLLPPLRYKRIWWSGPCGGVFWDMHHIWCKRLGKAHGWAEINGTARTRRRPCHVRQQPSTEPIPLCPSGLVAP